MYKIYINEIPVLLKATENLTIGELTKGETYVIKYNKKPKQILNLIEQIEKGIYAQNIILHSNDFISLKADFISNLTVVEAAGGLIENESGEFLYIFRRGHWDLPKGKIEKSETKRQAAVREVMEETGIKDVTIDEKLTVTYHVFTTKSGNRVLKKSHWYHMKAKKQKLKPQKSEDILKAEWTSINQLSEYNPIYGNITQVMEAYISKFGSIKTVPAV